MDEPDWDVPFLDEVPAEESPVSRDPIYNSAVTGLEAEAMIKKYGGDLFPPVESAPLATTHRASLFRDSLPADTGMNLPPDFAREFDRVATANNDRSVSKAVAKHFRFSKLSSEKFLTRKRLPRN